MARKKLTPLEQQVWDLWDELAFRDGRFAGKPLTREALTQRDRERAPEWDAILALAHDGNEWKVGLFVASTVSGSRWHRRMILREYPEAEAEIDRLQSHPDWSKASRIERSEAAIRKSIAQMGQGDFTAACVALKDWIEDGPKRRATMALLTVGPLSELLADLPDREVTPELVALVTTVAARRRAGKKIERTCAEIKTTREAFDCLHAVMGWER